MSLKTGINGKIGGSSLPSGGTKQAHTACERPIRKKVRLLYEVRIVVPFFITRAVFFIKAE